MKKRIALVIIFLISTNINSANAGSSRLRFVIPQRKRAGDVSF
ncbi:hypothetical protein ES707_13091 [subsurface metagenome]